MPLECQTPWPNTGAPVVVLVAGPAGSGKTTLGTALARALGLAPLDLDSVTNPLLDALDPAVFGGHWLRGAHVQDVRTGRYAALLTTAADLVAVGQGAVLIAPFTRELDGGPEWADLVHRLSPATVFTVHMTGTPDLFAGRRSRRDTFRDGFRSESVQRPPAIPVIAIDAVLAPHQQLFRALRALGYRSPATPQGSPIVREFDGVLFDLDGTLADSTPAVLRSWARLAAEFGFDESAVHQNHGKPAQALLRKVLAADQVERAAARVQEFEVEDVADVVATPGAVALLAALPAGHVAIVTSGKRPVARARIEAAGLIPPTVVVTRDDVTNGKPDPEPFVLAARRLGMDPARCLVVEDASAGIVAARLAGCTVAALRGTSIEEELAGADVVIDSLEQISVLASTPHIRLSFSSGS